MASTTKLGKGKQPVRAVDFVDVTDGRKRKRVRLGVVTHNEAVEAKRRIEKLLNARILNQCPTSETAEWLAAVPDHLHNRIARTGLCEPREPASASLTLGEWVTKYLGQRKSDPKFKSGSYDRLRQTGDRMLVYFGAHTPIDEITPNAAKDWRVAMIAEPLAEATARLHCRNAKTIFGEAVDRELISRSPFAKLKSSSVAADNDRIIDANETLKLLDASPDVQWRVLIGLARLAGLRVPSETHILSWDAVDWAKRQLTVYAPKTDSTRFVPIVPELHTILTDAWDQAPAGAKNIVTLSRNNLHRDFKLIVKRAGVKPWDDLWQTLRRSAETMFAETHPQKDVSAWIGHSVKVSLKHYAKPSETQFQAAANSPVLTSVESSAESAAVKSSIEHAGGRIETKRRNEESTLLHEKSQQPFEVAGFSEVGGGGFEPPTPGFSILCSTN